MAEKKRKKRKHFSKLMQKKLVGSMTAERFHTNAERSRTAMEMCLQKVKRSIMSFSTV